MKLDDQVCSLELAKRLKELGVKQESAFYWVRSKTMPAFDWQMCYGPFHGSAETISAFTVAELGEVLPHTHTSFKSELGHFVCHDPKSIYGLAKAATEADARAKMLIYLIEQGIVKP